MPGASAALLRRCYCPHPRTAYLIRLIHAAASAFVWHEQQESCGSLVVQFGVALTSLPLIRRE